MAITLTTINGTDSVASSRITINDNYSTIGNALNSVLSIIDIATGKIDNFCIFTPEFSPKTVTS